MWGRATISTANWKHTYTQQRQYLFTSIQLYFMYGGWKYMTRRIYRGLAPNHKKATLAKRIDNAVLRRRKKRKMNNHSCVDFSLSLSFVQFKRAFWHTIFNGDKYCPIILPPHCMYTCIEFKWHLIYPPDEQKATYSRIFYVLQYNRAD